MQKESSPIKKMNNLLDVYELIDNSSSSEEEGEITRASTPLPRDSKEFPRIVVEILNLSAEATADEEMADSPESPDESLSSDIFVVEASANNEESVTSSMVAEYLEKVRQEDSSSYFSAPPGTPRKISFKPASPLNDLEKRIHTTATTPITASQLRAPGSVNLLTRAAFSQPAPGLACGCRRSRIGRGHEGNVRFPKSYFNW